MRNSPRFRVVLLVAFSLHLWVGASAAPAVRDAHHETLTSSFTITWCLLAPFVLFQLYATASSPQHRTSNAMLPAPTPERGRARGELPLKLEPWRAGGSYASNAIGQRRSISAQPLAMSFRPFLRLCAALSATNPRLHCPILLALARRHALEAALGASRSGSAQVRQLLLCPVAYRPALQLQY